MYIQYIGEKCQDTMEIQIVYDNNKDREFLNLVDLKLPFFIEYIKSTEKEAYALKSYWAAKKNPFVVVTDNDKIIKVFYSEGGTNAISQLINYLSDERKN